MRLIDADALCEYANNTKDKTVDANDIMRFQTVNAVPVIRCKDCKWWAKDYDICRRGNRRLSYENDWCCAHGERREEMIISRKRYEREMNREQERLLELDAMNSNIKALAKQISELLIRVRKLEVDLITHTGREAQWRLRDEKLVRCADCKWFDISEPSGTVEPIFYKCKRKRRFVESDDFCKYGEARE